MSRIRAPSNPLLIPLVLSKVLSHVDGFEDLKKFRLVCRLWRDMSLDKWRNSATLRLWWKKGHNNICCFSCPPKGPFCTYGRDTLDIESFLELVQNSMEREYSGPIQLASKPFAHYRILQCSIIDSNSNICEVDNLQRLLRVCGSHMTYLDLDHLAVFSDCYAEFFTFLREFPNLRELSVLFAPVERSLPQTNEGGNLRKFLRSLGESSLETVSISQCKETYKVDMPTLWEWRRLFDTTANLKKLTVDVGGGWKPSIEELKLSSVSSTKTDFHWSTGECKETVVVTFESKTVDETGYLEWIPLSYYRHYVLPYFM